MTAKIANDLLRFGRILVFVQSTFRFLNRPDFRRLAEAPLHIQNLDACFDAVAERLKEHLCIAVPNRYTDTWDTS
jgi:hypothetical protein